LLWFGSDPVCHRPRQQLVDAVDLVIVDPKNGSSLKAIAR
jgi:hypothetical protein